MSSFVSLLASLEGWFDKSFEELPKDLQKLVERGFRPRAWDKQTAEDRQSRAEMWDGYHDPQLKAEERRLWDISLSLERDRLKRRIEELEKIAPVNVSEDTAKELKLSKLNEKLDEVSRNFKGVNDSKVSKKTKTRNSELQEDANKLADSWFREGKRNFTKLEIADELAKSHKFHSMTSATIRRIIRIGW